MLVQVTFDVLNLSTNESDAIYTEDVKAWIAVTFNEDSYHEMNGKQTQLELQNIEFL